MSNKQHHGHKWMPIMYVTYFGILKEVAETHGYALAVHGSVVRVFDIVAVPWREDRSSHRDLLLGLREAIGVGLLNDMPYDSVERKPGGRIAYTIMAGAGGYFDISITPFIE